MDALSPQVERELLPVVHPAVIFQALPDGAVLFSTEDEVYFGLNEVGALVWELLARGVDTREELCAAVAARYPDVDAATVRQDVAELLADFATNGLVRRRD